MNAGASHLFASRGARRSDTTADEETRIQGVGVSTVVWLDVSACDRGAVPALSSSAHLGEVKQRPSVHAPPLDSLPLDGRQLAPAPPPPHHVSPVNRTRSVLWEPRRGGHCGRTMHVGGGNARIAKGYIITLCYAGRMPIARFGPWLPLSTILLRPDQRARGRNPVKKDRSVLARIVRAQH